MKGKVDESMDVVAAVIEKDGRILIARRKEGSFMAGRWEFPGGKVEENETQEKALAREMKEELGIKVVVGDLVHSDEHLYEVAGKKRKVTLFFYRCKMTEGTIRCVGCSEYKWVVPKELKDYDFVDGDVAFVEKLTV